MSNSFLVSFDDLQIWTGYNRKADIINWLENKHIPYEVAFNGEPITTHQAINKALLGEPNHEQWNFDTVQART
ncbi:DUF4224 domain-containing protein [Hydrogenovibrio marinus]|uniref:DUF4224 domain-containing protein n=1 Tax=Hydrogenovibrio marinus TaxID=28885 RepID=A0A066ZLY7_HYDMR|nr:DUF4224 domain-containing protein [Hydrogenovibrio marinus]KDN94823.1 hypothetical protein EI16_00470 [Hydrogenovibrio marinus]BBN59282.1 hypothetical protein HVMH_0876 [Hydrogenovibrio marinus]